MRLATEADLMPCNQAMGLKLYVEMSKHQPVANRKFSLIAFCSSFGLIKFAGRGTGIKGVLEDVTLFLRLPFLLVFFFFSFCFYLSWFIFWLGFRIKERTLIDFSERSFFQKIKPAKGETELNEKPGGWSERKDSLYYLMILLTGIKKIICELVKSIKKVGTLSYRFIKWK